MLESVRNFLSGRRVIIVAILLAIPFVFFGSTSFGTTFTSFGTVNGESVSQMDLNIATNQVSERLQSIYGEEFSLDELDEEVALSLIQNEIINQKILLSKARDLGIIVSEKQAKQEIINLDEFQGESGFDQRLFESSIRANGWTPEESINYVRERLSLEKLVSAMSLIAFPIEDDRKELVSLLETSRDIDFIKVEKNIIVNQQQATLEEGEEFYNNNPFIFLSKEKRDFSYIVLDHDTYKSQVKIPDDFVEEAYGEYLVNSEKQIQNRISHLMIEKSNYQNTDEAYKKISSIYESISLGEISFEDAVEEFTEDLASKDSIGDLGLSSGGAFPDEFEKAILSLELETISSIIELDDSLHIIKLTEVIKPEVKSKAEISKQLTGELIDAEALALMEDDFLEIETMVLEGLTLNSIASSINAAIQITGLKTIDEIQLNGFETVTQSELFDQKLLPNKIQIYEGNDNYVFVMLTQIIQPEVQPFINVAELSMEEVRINKANKIIEDFASVAPDVLNGEQMLPKLEGFSKENYKGVKRFSSLLPPEIINSTFESPIGAVISNESFNGDRYWAKSINEKIPSKEVLSELSDQYQGFYNENLGQQFSGFIDHTLSKGQKVRLKNLTTN
ncbi:MAG: hypothetical protein CMD68_01040 [Gammaproteobacteria bacterium]|nr:hypothetical protein [Gammaproteobacteria bacterium]